MFTKIKLAIYGIGIILIISLFALWRNTSTKLENTCQLLTEAEATIQSLQIANQKLLEYNTQKQAEIKEIEQKYKDLLNAAPSDKCGDTKPTEELLKFLRENAE